ncbi:hypothetical protein SIM91_44275 [Rhodococcus opacus]|nr:hypothetical protein [Rhodococcus opacus]
MRASDGDHTFDADPVSGGCGAAGGGLGDCVPDLSHPSVAACPDRDACFLAGIDGQRPGISALIGIRIESSQLVNPGGLKWLRSWLRSGLWNR